MESLCCRKCAEDGAIVHDAQRASYDAQRNVERHDSKADVVGGRDAITPSARWAAPRHSPCFRCFIVLRFALGPVSYAAGTPGGLFARMLVLGSQSGLVFGILCGGLFPS